MPLAASLSPIWFLLSDRALWGENRGYGNFRILPMELKTGNLRSPSKAQALCRIEPLTGFDGIKWNRFQRGRCLKGYAQFSTFYSLFLPKKLNKSGPLMPKKVAKNGRWMPFHLIKSRADLISWPPGYLCFFCVIWGIIPRNYCFDSRLICGVNATFCKTKCNTPSKIPLKN